MSEKEMDVLLADMDAFWAKKRKKSKKMEKIKEKRPHNKNLKELGLYDDPRKSFKCKDRISFQKERNKYGFDSREFWELNDTIARFVYTRLTMFLEYYNPYIDNGDGSWSEKEVDLTEPIETILIACEEYLKGTPDELWDNVQDLPDITFQEALENDDENFTKFNDYLYRHGRLNREAYALIDKDERERLEGMQQSIRMVAELLPELNNYALVCGCDLEDGEGNIHLRTAIVQEYVKEGRPHNEDLKALGIYDDPRKPFKCKDSIGFQRERLDYGFDSREIVVFTNTLARFLYTRLILFKRKTIADLTWSKVMFEDIEYNVLEAIDTILDECAEYLTKGAYIEDTEGIRHAVRLLAEIFPSLWD